MIGHLQVLCLEEEEFLATGILGQLSPFLLLFASSCLFLAPSLHRVLAARGHIVSSVEKIHSEFTAPMFRQLPTNVWKNGTRVRSRTADGVGVSLICLH